MSIFAVADLIILRMERDVQHATGVVYSGSHSEG